MDSNPRRRQRPDSGQLWTNLAVGVSVLGFAVALVTLVAAIGSGEDDPSSPTPSTAADTFVSDPLPDMSAVDIDDDGVADFAVFGSVDEPIVEPIPRALDRDDPVLPVVGTVLAALLAACGAVAAALLSRHSESKLDQLETEVKAYRAAIADASIVDADRPEAVERTRREGPGERPVAGRDPRTE